MLKDGRNFLKQAILYEESKGMIIVRFLNPIENRFFLHISDIKALLVVDMVIDKEYFNKNMRPTTGKQGLFIS